MIIPRLAWKASLPGVLAVAVASVVVFTSGCSMTNLTSVDNTPLTGAAIQGKVHGGQFPVGGATIGLYVAGSTGYGTSGGNLLTTTVTTAADGSFNITGDYKCPTSSSLVYLSASGGNPGVGSGSNLAIEMVAPLGACGNLTTSTFINVNEVTTAAAAVALGQFFNPAFTDSSTDTFGTSATNISGLTNAFATVNNLVNVGTGQAVTTATLANGGLSITATPESAKLNTIANILAACVNSDGSGSSPCPTLFAAVTPTGGTAPTDTLQAAVDMSLNPTSNNATTSATNMASLFGLQTGTAPFVGLAAQPTDWTIGIQYSGASPLLTEAQNIAADAQGNIWIANDPASVNNGLTELSPTGTPMVNTLTGAGTGAGTTLGSLTPRNLAIDTNGNVWVTTSSSSGLLFEYTPSSQAVTFSTIGHSPYGLAIDGNNNVFFGEQSSSVATIYEMVGGVNNATTNLVEYPVLGAVQNPEYLAVDASGNVWAASATSAITYVVQLSNINTSSCGAPPFTAACTVTTTPSQNTFAQISQGSIDEPFGLAADATGMWVVNTKDTANNGTVTKLALSGATVSGGTNYGLGAVNQPRFPAVDGAGNVWVSNRGTSAVAEFAGNGAVLSPGTGFVHSGLASGNGITVDPSGNVWVANASSTATSVLEIVGSAAPTVTPIAQALKSNKVGQKP